MKYLQLITSLSLCLLLRAPTLMVAASAACIAILSKLLLIQGKHIFNPANIGIVLSVCLFDAWISPGQWGREAWLLFVFIGLGFIVSMRAARADVAIAFLLTFMLLIMDHVRPI